MAINRFSFARPKILVATELRTRHPARMKTSSLLCSLIIASCSLTYAGTPAQEKAFTDKYKTAFEGKDTATLESFLYTTGSDPKIVEFYKMMMSGEAGSKISKIELLDLTPEEAKKAGESQDLHRRQSLPAFKAVQEACRSH